MKVKRCIHSMFTFLEFFKRILLVCIVFLLISFKLSGQTEIENARLRQFEADVKKLNSEIDIMKIVKSIRDTKTTMNNMMKHMIKIKQSTYRNQNGNDQPDMEEDIVQQD